MLANTPNTNTHNVQINPDDFAVFNPLSRSTKAFESSFLPRKRLSRSPISTPPNIVDNNHSDTADISITDQNKASTCSN